MYADRINRLHGQGQSTETNRRRKIQDEYNKATWHNAKTIIKEIRMPLAVSAVEEAKQDKPIPADFFRKAKTNRKTHKDMKQAAKELDFESAAIIRDRIKQLMG